MAWGTPQEIERRRRINLAVWAYAYEVLDHNFVSDHEFDRQCGLVDLTISTGNRRLDLWFKANFAACTGQWVHKHPDKKRLADICRRLIPPSSKVTE